MFFSTNIKIKQVGILLVIMFVSCKGILRDDSESKPLARVGETYLYPEDIASLVADATTKQDSAVLVTNYINNWASKQLFLSKSKINLSGDKLAEFDQLVNNYRTDLYTRAYIEALILKERDTALTVQELRGYYEEKKQNFKLNEKLVQLRFIEVPTLYLDKQAVANRLKDFEEKDKSYLDSIAVQFKKIHLNDSVWASASQVLRQIRVFTPVNQDKYLKKSQFFELQDSLGVYLGKVTNVLQVGDVAPFDYVQPDIKLLILNKRQLELKQKLETEIIDEAIKSKEFEIYRKN